MLQVVTVLRADHARLVEEVKRIESVSYNTETLMPYARAYVGDQDITIRVEEEEDETYGKLPVIRQSASGGGESREIKEAFRRAFCRLVLQEMHRSQMEVSISVT